MLLSNLIHENIEKYGEYSLLYYEDEVILNVQIEKIGRQFAQFLASLGISKGDRVLVCMPNRPEVVYAYQGILRSGAIVIPVMHLLHEKEINFIIDNSEAKAVITSSDILPKIKRAVKQLPQHIKIVSVDSTEPRQMN